MPAFEGFTPDVHRWFKGLEAENTKEYFAAHREFFETAVRGQLEALLLELSHRFRGEVKLFRQNRDIRFSRDKSPYKTNSYGVLHGTDIAAHGLYVSISAGGLVAASGYHVMARDQLERFRDAVADDGRGPELVKRLAKAQRSGLETWGESLATAPRGYPKDHSRIDLLRRKSLTLVARLDAQRGIDRKEGLKFVAGTWRAAAPVTAWLDENVGETTLPTGRAGFRR